MLELVVGLAMSALALSAQTATAVRMPSDAARGTAALHASTYAPNSRARIHRDVATTAPLANRYFDEGLSLYYEYRHIPAAQAFREAERLDARCVMCVVGEAMALGPSIDATMSTSDADAARTAALRAMALVRDGAGSVADAAWARALATRYLGRESAPRASRDSAYARAMSHLADAYPGDADAQTLAAEAAMILSPYRYWSADGVMLPAAQQALPRLVQAMRVAPGHHGACYLYVHLMEAVTPGVGCGVPRR